MYQLLFVIPKSSNPSNIPRLFFFSDKEKEDIKEMSDSARAGQVRYCCDGVHPTAWWYYHQISSEEAKLILPANIHDLDHLYPRSQYTHVTKNVELTCDLSDEKLKIYDSNANSHHSPPNIDEAIAYFCAIYSKKGVSEREETILRFLELFNVFPESNVKSAYERASQRHSCIKFCIAFFKSPNRILISRVLESLLVYTTHNASLVTSGPEASLMSRPKSLRKPPTLPKQERAERKQAISPEAQKLLRYSILSVISEGEEEESLDDPEQLTLLGN